MKPNHLKFLFLILIGFFFSCRKYDLRKEHGEINRLNENIIQFSPLLNANGSVQISGYTRSPKQHSLYAVLLDSAQYVSSHYDVTGNLYFSPIANLTGRFSNEISQPVSGMKDNVEYVAYIVDSESPNPSTTALYQTKSNPFRFAKVGNLLLTSVKSTNIDTNIINFNTKDASNLRKVTATLNGEIVKINPSTKVIEYGFYWKKADNSSPDFAVLLKSDTAKLGIFSSDLAALAPNTAYIYRAFVRTNVGEYVGVLKSFTTPVKDLATVQTLVVDSAMITYSGVRLKGQILSMGDAYASESGIMYGTEKGLSNDKVITVNTSNPSINVFEVLVNYLKAGTTYYYKAYAKTYYGISYGDELSFTTTPSSKLASITTLAVSGITSTTAKGDYNLLSSGGSNLTDYGMCWSTSPNPTIADNKLIENARYSKIMYSLTPNTTYYVRAYATNSAGTAYGNEVSFTTLPTISTLLVNIITRTNVVSGGNMTGNGDAVLLSKGICWSTMPNPTITDSTTLNGTDVINFQGIFRNLKLNTNYYVRAYATNSSGTSYGNNINFLVPPPTIPIITTSQISNITNTQFISGGESIDDGGSTITAKGICWSTSSNPTITNTKTTDGTGIANFTSTISGLISGTTYYARAYAINSIGTAYGNQYTIVTTNIKMPSITTVAASNITSSSITSGGSSINAGGGNVLEKGIVWSMNSLPTIADNKIASGNGTSNFSSSITGLSEGASYYFRAYVTNEIGTSYGSQFIARTTILTLPSVTTLSISKYTNNVVSSGGTITSNGNGNILSKGVCWSTSSKPTLTDSHTNEGAGNTNYSSILTGLISENVYYVRAYVTNELGTTYGNEQVFNYSTVKVEVSTFAGKVTSGSADGVGTSASFYHPHGIAVDKYDNVFVAEGGNKAIRKISPNGVVSTFVSGVGTFIYPTGVAVDDSGNVFVADNGGGYILKFNEFGILLNKISVGTSPSGVIVGLDNNIYVVSEGRNQILKLTQDGIVSVLAGAATIGSTDGLGANARFYRPFGIAIDANGNLYIADTYNNKIRKVTNNGVVSTLAGTGTAGFLDGIGTIATFTNPRGVAVDKQGNVYVADDLYNLIRKISPQGYVSTIAGTRDLGSINGLGSVSTFDGPNGVGVDSQGNVYVAEFGNNQVRKITILP